MGNFGPPPTYGQSLYPSTETLNTTAFNTPASSTSTNWVDAPTSPELLENDYTWRIETPDACRCILVKQSHGSKIYFIPQLQDFHNLNILCMRMLKENATNLNKIIKRKKKVFENHLQKIASKIPLYSREQHFKRF